jgi:N-acetylmuramoyl-L-alanine amidase
MRFEPMQRPHSILVLDPAGDVRHTGRIIDDTFERSITLQCAQELKRYLEYHNPILQVIISRTAGQIRDQIQIASLTNRLAAHIFIHLCCYQESGPRPTLNIFYMTTNPITDAWVKPSSNSFISYCDAYTISLNVTKKIVSQLHTTISSFSNLFDVRTPIGVPCAALAGIMQPTFVIEIGLKTHNDWHQFIEPLAKGIEQFFTEHRF